MACSSKLFMTFVAQASGRAPAGYVRRIPQEAHRLLAQIVAFDLEAVRAEL